MNQDHVVGKVSMIGRKLIAVENDIAYQYSAKLYLELDMSKAKGFEGLLLSAMCLPAGAKKPIHCPMTEEDQKQYIILPDHVLQQEGTAVLSIGGISNEKVVVTSNCVALYIGASNRLTNIEQTPAEEYWQIEVKKAMEYWFTNTIIPLYNEQKDQLDILISDTSEKVKELSDTSNLQQKAVDDRIKDLYSKLEQGAFDGSTVLGGLGEPAADLGQQGDWYINQSNEGVTAWHIYKKEEAGWVDQRSIIGRDGNNKNLFGTDLETAEMLTPFYELHSKAEVIALQQNLPTESHKISSNDIYYKDSVDESKTVEKVLERCLSQSVKDGDLNDLTQDGTYTCVNCTNTPEAAVILNVMTFDTFKIQIANKPNSHNIYKRYYDVSVQVWSNWKLIAGEVLLWSGDITSGTVNLSKSLNIFDTVVVMIDAKRALTGVNIADSPYVFCSTSFPQSDGIYTDACLFTKVNDTTLSAGYGAAMVSNKYNNNHSVKVENHIIKIIGRP